MALPPSVEVKFIQERAGAIDPAFTVPATFDEQRVLVGPKAPEHALKAAMEQYKALKCEPRLEFNVDNCSWSELFKILEAAQEDYAAKARSGFRGSIRRLGRDAGEKSETILQLIDAIPSEFGLSIIRAGLGWMFTIAKQCKQARGEIFDLFAEFPSIVMEVEEARHHFKNEPELMHLADSTESEIINATLKLIKYLLPKHQAEKVFTILSDVPSASSVSEIVSNVRKPAQALKRHSDVLFKGLAIDTNRNTQAITKEIQATRYNTVIINGRMEKMEEQFISFQSMYQNVRRSEQTAFDMYATGIDALNGLFRILREQKEAVEARQACIQASIESGFTRAFQMGVDTERHRVLTSHPMPSVLLSADQLLLDINITSQQLVGDLEQALRQAWRLDPLAKSQAQQLFRMDRFWSWYTRTSSDLIMVHARFPNKETLNRTSPLSATSGTLITSILRERPGDIALYFFCGQHATPRDPLAGPQGAMRCLLARLLVEVRVRSQFDIPLEPTSANNLVEGIRHHNMEAMCHIFRLLIAYVPQETTVFCIVDGLSWLDQPNHVADTLRMIQLFRSLVSDPGLRSAFKFLLTGPWSSGSFNAVISTEEQIDLVQGALMMSTMASSPLFNRNVLSPSQYQSRLFQNR